ncbi:MAG: glycoside hydrolase family 30 protein [Desulfobacteraceae bacterium]
MTILYRIQTVRDSGDRLSPIGSLAMDRSDQPHLPLIDVDVNRSCQEILGFGGAFTESACHVLSRLPDSERQNVLRAYFHPDDGIGYRLARTHINSCDFSLENWSCWDAPGADLDLSRYEKAIFPIIREAQGMAATPIRLLASPWSPPAWMKTNGQMTQGGYLLPAYRNAWAEAICDWTRGCEQAGIDIWGLTVQNEPAATQVWESCLYSAEEERGFVRDHLGPALHGAGLDHLRLLIWDHNRDLVFERAQAVLSDPQAARYIWGTGIHWYSGDQFENLDRLHRAFPDKHLLFTEGCWEGGVKPGRWDRGERYAHHIIGDLNNWTEGWLDWNLVLDQHGGPNHVGNWCDAPIIVDTEQRTWTRQSSYWYIGHFSRYMHPGARRLFSTQADNGLESVAARNPDGGVVVVICNAGGEPLTAALRIDGVWTELTVPAHAIQTLLTPRLQH